MLKKFPSDKINDAKNALLFLSRVPTHHSFTFNLRFLYEMNHKVRLSKTVCEIFHFRFCLTFTKVYIFVKTDKITYSECSLEKRMTIAKISLHCNLK